MRNQAFRSMVFLILICLGITCVAGCLSPDEAPISGGDISVIPAGTDYPDYAGTYLEGPLRITVPEFVQYWSADGTCYWEGSIRVENTGAVTENNVIIRSSLIDIESGEAADTDLQTFPKVGVGNLSFDVKLHGACDGRYTIRVETFAN